MARNKNDTSAYLELARSWVRFVKLDSAKTVYTDSIYPAINVCRNTTVAKPTYTHRYELIPETLKKVWYSESTIVEIYKAAFDIDYQNTNNLYTVEVEIIQKKDKNILFYHG